MSTIFTEQNIGLFLMGLFFIAIALYATYRANQQEREKKDKNIDSAVR